MTTTPRDNADDDTFMRGDDAEYGADPTGGSLEDIARRGAREWERDMAAWEGDAEQLRLKRRSISEVLWEAMQRGDRVTVTVVGHIFTGSLSAVRNDLAVLGTADGSVALHLHTVAAVSMEPSPTVGVVGDRTYGSWRSYLGMLEVEQPLVRVLGLNIDVTGRVTAVAADHVVMETAAGATWAVAIAQLGVVVAAT